MSRLGQLNESDAADREAEPYKLTDIVRVSIVLDKAPTLERYSAQNVAENASAMAYRAGLKSQQEATTNKVETALGGKLDVKWNLTLAMNAISANVRYGDIAKIREVEGVKSVELENRYDPMPAEVNTATTTDAMVGATALWANGYTGAGTRIAIIDTGTDHEHQSFDPEALEYALAEDGGEYNLLTWEEISGLADQLNVSVNESVYKNTKVPYAYSYVDKNYVTDHMGDTQGEHGSHVAGIAAANRYVKIDGEFVDAAENVFAVGVAPDAQIITMKVFGAGGGAYDSDYMVAIEDAIVLGCDSCNLSLGSGSPGFTLSGSYEKTMDSLVDSGTVVSISAGNSGAWNDVPKDSNMYPYLYAEDAGYHTGGSPGSFINSLGVASADNIGVVGAPLVFNGERDVYPNETSGYGNEPIATLAGDTVYDYVLVDGPGVDDNGNVGKEGDQFWALGSDVLTGKVAICYRGSSSFFAKANAAAAQGAIAVLIINNQDGTINMNLEGYNYTAPAVSLLKADGDAVKAESEPVADNEGNVLYYTGTMTVGEVGTAVLRDRSEATISSFSSWGVPGSLVMKPEITAPGGSIYSVFGENKTSTGVAGGPAEYELMSGTSMAAPHVAGMAALLSQYIRDNDLETITGVNRRTLINSLLMSTATPMIDEEGEYYPIMQQGAGLGEANLATQAKSYITMNEDATASWQDGKVKVELGQDAKREGVYSYSFNVNNFSDVDMTYVLSTDIFTQAIAGDAGYGMLQYTGTMPIGADVTYDYPTEIPNAHDVNSDGVTDRADAQAILDKISGAYPADAAFDEEAADLDGDGAYTTYDAHLLLKWLQESFNELLVPAGKSVKVGVTITLDDEWCQELNAVFTNGFYVEGFTYVTPTAETADGEILGVEHSIPILGFYGFWTEPSMFDAVSPVEAAYGSKKIGYTGNGTNTNYLTVNYGKGNTIFMGNPYAVEDEFPADRLALNTKTSLVEFRYNLIRNAAATGFLALDEDYNVLRGSLAAGQTYSAYYHVNQGAWQNLTTRGFSVANKVGNLGVTEGDVFTLGYFAVPEYYGMTLHPGEKIGSVTADEVGQLLRDGELGHGAYVGYTFTADDTVPVVDEVTVTEGATRTMTIKAHDDRYIATVMLMDVYGNTVFAQEVPAQTEPGQTVEVTFELTGAMGNGVAVVVGDYACNENIGLARLSDGPITTMKTVYTPATTIEDGKTYIITSTNEVGNTKALTTPGSGSSYTVTSDVVIQEDDTLGLYIDPGDMVGLVFRANGTYTDYNDQNQCSLLQNTDDDLFISWMSFNSRAPYMSSTFKDTGFVYDAANSHMIVNTTRWLTYNAEQGNFLYEIDEAKKTPIYLWGEDSMEVEFDPTVTTKITVEPEEAVLVLDYKPTVQLSAEVKPVLLEDKSVTWSTGDPAVATVDGDGLVTAQGVGTTTITATTNAEPHLSDTVSIRVEEITASADIRGSLSDAEGKTHWMLFNSDAPQNWESVHESTYFDAAALFGDTLYAVVNNESIFAIDADTYEETNLGAIVSDWCYSDGAPLPADLAQTLGLPGFTVVGPCNNGTYLEILNPEEGRLQYFNQSSVFGTDPMATIAYVGRDNAEGAVYYVLTEGGKLWNFTIDVKGELKRTEIGATGLQLSGVASLNNKASMVYDEASDFLFLSYYDGNSDIARLYAINPNDPAVNGELGNFGDKVRPVVGLYQYEPATDLVLKVNPTEITLFETQTKELNVKVKLGETNEYTAQVADPTIASVEDGVVTGLKAGETTITITTTDVNDAGEHLSETVTVTVKERVSIDAFVTGQVTDAQGTRFAKINLEDLSVSSNGVEAPGDVISGGRTGDIYMLDVAGAISALDAEDMTTPAQYPFDTGTYAQYPAQDIANYPVFLNEEEELDESKALMTTSLGWLVSPNSFRGWNMSSLIPGMAGICFAGTDEVNGTPVYVYFIIDTDGILYQMLVDYTAGTRTDPQRLLETGITVEDQSALSMAMLQNLGFTAGQPAVKSAGLVIANNEDKTMWYVDLLADGEVGLIGTLDAENVSGLIGTFDDLATVVDPADMPGPDPLEEAEVLWESSFEDDPAQEGWSFVDSDGDNNNWIWSNGGTNVSVHDGASIIYSQSYAEGTALTPDNWAISPAIDMTNMTDDGVLSIYAAAQDPDYAAEHFALYAGTSADPAEMTQISDEFVATGKYKRYTADLSQFAGEETVYVAVRHFNVTDQFYLNVDLAQVLHNVPNGTGAAPAPTVDLSKYAAPELNGLRPVGDGFATLLAPVSDEREMTRFSETANDTRGGLNAMVGDFKTPIRTLADLAAVVAVTTEDDDTTQVITISEDVAITNGLYTVTYDPEKLTFIEGNSDAELYSIHNDAENGVVTVSVAATDEIPAGAIATVKFKVPCSDSTVTVVTKERGTELDLEETEEVALVGIGHEWGEPVWNWSDDHSTATAVFTCLNDPNHVEEIEATITKDVTEATCEEEGNTVYTATVTGPDGKTYTDTQAEINDPNGHDWGEPVWNWSADKKTAKVTFTCKTDESHRVTLDATVTVKTTDATCDKAGSTVFTGTVTGPDGETYTDTQTETIPALGHDWGEPVWTWSKDKKTATATFTCKNCGEKKEIVDSKVQVKTDKDGKTTHTATITGPDGKTYTNTVKVASVNTGDTFHLALYVGLAAVCAAGLVVLFLHNKKKENRG